MSDLRASLANVLGDSGDEMVMDYVANVLEDTSFEWGHEGEGAYEAVGELLVDGGFVENDKKAKEACAKLAALHAGSGNNGGTGFRALEGGPVRLADDAAALVVDDVDVRHRLENPLGNAVPKTTEKDRLKLEKRQMREEEKQRAFIQARQAEAEAMLRDNIPTIKRLKLSSVIRSVDVVLTRGGGVVGNVKLEDFSVSNGGQELVQNGELLLATGRRYGLVGRNGTGKTTMLRALANGEIKGIPSNCQVVHVEQEARGDETTVMDAVLQCDVERTELLAEERELSKQLEQSNDDRLSRRLKAVYDRLQEIDADHAEAKAASILAGLSFTPEMQKYKTKQLSGGWRMRAALARALFIEPDLLLLDEPTNHLDLHAVIWLEECLQKWPKTLLVVSHARHFLNVVCTEIVHLHSHKLTTYKGDFDTFERTMRDRLLTEQKRAEAQDRQRKHVQAFIDRFRFNAKRASLVQSRIKALERMAEASIVERDPEYVFRFPDTEVTSTNVVRFIDVDFGYPDRPALFSNLNFGIGADSRFAIVGSNGIGKTTLLNLIEGTLEPIRGHVERNPKARFAIFSQHHVDGLDLALTPLQYMGRQFPTVKEQQLRSHLGSFGICGPLALQTMYTLSGGQKSRVALSKVTWCRPSVLLLDEPSNHLDMDAVDALIEGLTMFKGAVLMVSHDQYLIESAVDELWMCENGQVTSFHGTFEDYKARLRRR